SADAHCIGPPTNPGPELTKLEAAYWFNSAMLGAVETPRKLPSRASAAGEWAWSLAVLRELPSAFVLAVVTTGSAAAALEAAAEEPCIGPATNPGTALT